MRVTQGCFSFLPDLSNEQIAKQVDYAVRKNWAVSIEFTDDPHPRNAYWELWGLPLFDIQDGSAIMYELASCKKSKPNYYIKINAFDNTRGVESCCMSFIVNRPMSEPGFGLTRQEVDGRNIRYTIHSYATDRPENNRY